MAHASLIATLLDPPSPDGADLAALPEAVEWLEVRADRVGDIDPEWLRSHFKGRLLYALRTQDGRDQHGNRAHRLQTAARFYDRVEPEIAGDQFESIPPEQRLLSWYGHVNDVSTLTERFEQLASVPAAIYKLVTNAAGIAEEFLPLTLLNSLKRDDTIAFATGPLGFWNRIVGLQLGVPAIYGLVGRGSVADMEPSVGKLIGDYGLPAVVPANELFAIVGDPIFHSLSPRMHNASYRAMNHRALFVPLRVQSFAELCRAFGLL